MWLNFMHTVTKALFSNAKSLFVVDYCILMCIIVHKLCWIGVANSLLIRFYYNKIFQAD